MEVKRGEKRKHCEYQDQKLSNMKVLKDSSHHHCYYYYHWKFLVLQFIVLLFAFQSDGVIVDAVGYARTATTSSDIMNDVDSGNSNTAREQHQEKDNGQDSSSSSSSSSYGTALHAAQNLEVPKVTSTSQGESEHMEFWESHEELLKTAWEEWSSSSKLSSTKSSSALLPPLEESEVINSTIINRINEIWENPTKEKEERFRKDFIEQPLEGVHAIKKFISVEGIRQIRQHLQAVESSQIPTRRPNGMNRFGIVMDDETPGGVWYWELAQFRKFVVDSYVRPLGRMLFPELAGNVEDDSSAYAFTIQYSNDHDIELKEHSDASVYTMNINLNDPDNKSEQDRYEGSSLIFRNDTTNVQEEIALEPGMAILHRGLHRHQALPISKGHRLQLVIWLFGNQGYVRFAPYESQEQMTVEQRWTKPPESNPTTSSSSSSVIQDACWNLQAYD